ncbi:MAG: hypothetical protein ACREK8_03045 [Gemmatimonadales bacterium]
MNRNRSLVAVATAAAVLAIGTAPRAHASSLVDPCSLLTTAQVSSAIGGQAQAGKPIYATGCSWSSTAPKAMVTISFDKLATFDSLKAASSPVVQKTMVSGIGDDAFYKTMGPMITLTVKKGGTYFVMRVYGISDPAKVREIERILATDAAAKL